MTDLMVPCFIAVGLLLGVGVLLHRKISNDRLNLLLQGASVACRATLQAEHNLIIQMPDV